MGPLAAALGESQVVTFKGQDYDVHQLDFADLADLEEWLSTEPRSDEEHLIISAMEEQGITSAQNYSNPLSRLRTGKVAHQLLILFLCLRKGRPGLTRAGAAALITARDYQKPETGAFLSQVLHISGVLPDALEEAKSEDKSSEDKLSEDEPNAEQSSKKVRARKTNTDI